MKTALLILLMFCLAEADDIRWEFQQFKRQLEEQHAAKFSELASRLTASETKITEQKHKADQLQSSNEQFQDQLNLLTKQQDCLKRKLCEQDGFTYGGGLCYYISTETKTWDESRQWCRDRHSDLVIIKSKEKEDLVVSLNKPVWLGLTDKVTEGIFQWVDGTPLTTPTYWRHGQPGFETSEYPNTGSDCVDYYDGYQSGYPTIGWGDAPCSDTLYWMCERSLC